VKKLFALLAVVALAAVGCDDKKTTAKPPDKTSGASVPSTHMTPDSTKTPATHSSPSTASALSTSSSPSKPDTAPPKKPEGPAVPPAGDSKDKKGDK
jgi:hypothetical protein